VRNRYLAVCTTYRRWLVGWWLLFLLPGLIGLSMDINRMQKVHEQPTNGEGQFLPGFENLIVDVLPFACLGCVLGIHLKELFGNSTGRLTPRLIGPHLAVAGLLVVGMTVCLPIVLAAGVGYRGPLLPLIAFALAAFSLPAVLMHWLPAAAVILFFLPVVLTSGWSPRLPLSVSVRAYALITLSLAGLSSIVLRLRNFNEEMREFDRRMPLPAFGWTRPSTTSGQYVAPWNPAPPIRRSLRTLAKPYPVSQETLWSCALHWDAGWRTFWRAGQQGILMVATLLVMALLSRPTHLKFDRRPAMLFMPVFLAAQWAVIPLWGTMYWNRGALAGEFLRPYARLQHVRAVGFVLAGATLASFALVIAALIAATWLSGFDTPAAERLSRELVFGGSIVPLFFAVTVWPFPTANWRLGNYVYQVAAMIPSVAIWMMVDTASNETFYCVMGLLAFLGLAMTGRAYRRWLDEDLT
jgi:hypothetical protein